MKRTKKIRLLTLLKKGHKTREIAKLAHVSNTTVKKIRQKLNAEAKEEQEQGDQRKKPLSIYHRHSTCFKRASPLSRSPLGLI
jgi:transposase